MAEEHRAASSGQSQPRREQAGAQRGQPQSGPRRRPPRRRSTAARVAGAFLYVLLVIGASGVLATVGWVWACDLLGLNKEPASTTIEIDEDTDFSAVVDQLEKEGLIEYKFLFKLYAWFSHAEAKIAPGTYELNTEMDYHALVSSMGSSSSTRKTADVTIKEGLTIDQVFELLDDRGVTSADKLRDMAANYDYAFDWLRERPLGDYHRLEGYLFPDTYTFELGENPKYVINKMLVNFDAKMDEYMASYTGEDVQYSLHDIVTIASPYNTYLHKGLPAGPISNPGMTSLLAAMNPADTNYYYYVLNPETKQHEYSRTYAEHDALVQRYQGNGG